jgi:hypothetical protein
MTENEMLEDIKTLVKMVCYVEESGAVYNHLDQTQICSCSGCSFSRLAKMYKEKYANV